MTEVEIAECTVATLTDKRDRTVARIEEIAAERKAVGFAVHADNDKAARKRGSISWMPMPLASQANCKAWTPALAEAQRRLEQARQDEARKADKRVVAKLPELLCRM
jgi:hypothetical protein